MGRNGILLRTMTARRAADASPDDTKFMRDHLKGELYRISDAVGPALAVVKKESDYESVDAAHERTHELVSRMNDGIRFNYVNIPDVLSKFTPLTVGADPAADLVKLTNINLHVGVVTPKFAWPSDLKHDDLKKAIVAHHEADELEKKLDETTKGALKVIRSMRAPAQALWDNGLDAWIEANIQGHEQQLAWGRERRKRPRKSAEEKEALKKKADEKKKGADQKKTAPQQQPATGEQEESDDAPALPPTGTGQS